MKRECVGCRKKKDGRFTRAKGSKGVPQWHCTRCLPLGDGSDEVPPTPDQKVKTAVVAQSVDLAATEQQGLALVKPTTPMLAFMVKTEADYLQADEMLGEIRRARKGWTSLWDLVQDKVVKPLRASLEGAYEVNRTVSKPLDDAEAHLKSQMKLYKDAETRRIMIEERKQQEEANRIQREIDAAARAAEAAKTPQIAKVLEKKVERLEAKQMTVLTQETAAPVMGSNTSVRKVRVAEITDWGVFYSALAEGDIENDADLTTAVNVWLMRRFREHGEGLSQWPGVTVRDEQKIVGSK